MTRLIRRFRLVVVLGAIAVAAIVALRVYTVTQYRDAVYEPEDVPSGRVALVFGAGVTAGGAPTSPLHDRIVTAVGLYHAGKVERLLLSGDGRTERRSEPAAMQRLAIELGVPDSAIQLDPGCLRTRISCVRARREFGVTQAVVVTQRFHLPRALLVCERAGIDVVGVASDERTYPWRWSVTWQAREAAATAVAWWDVTVQRQ